MRATISAPRVTCSRMTAASARSSLSGFVRIESGIPILPMSWKSAAVAEGAELLRGEAQLASDRERDAADPLGVAGRVRIARLDRGVQRLDRLEQGRLELPRGLDEVVRARLEVLVLRAHASGRAAHEQRERRARGLPKTSPTAYQTVAARVVDDLLDDGVVEGDLGRADDLARGLSAAAPRP